MFSSPSGHEKRDVWLRYGRWLVPALTFQLAADIIETSITTSWDAVGRIAAVAVIRTFLNYFLERDLAEVRERQETRDPAWRRECNELIARPAARYSHWKENGNELHLEGIARLRWCLP